MAMPKQLRRNKLQKSREVIFAPKSGFTLVEKSKGVIAKISKDLLAEEPGDVRYLHQKKEKDGKLYVIDMTQKETGTIIAFKESKGEFKWDINVISLEKIQIDKSYLLEEYDHSDIIFGLLEKENEFKTTYDDNPYYFAGMVEHDYALYALLHQIIRSVEKNMVAI